MGGVGPGAGGVCQCRGYEQFLFFFRKNLQLITKSLTLPAMTFMSYPYEPRKLQATESRLEAIMRAARLGLKGDRLAVAIGMTPYEYRQLCQLDPIVEFAELKARTQSEMEMSQVLHQAALDGDIKAATTILQNKHDWVAKQQISIDVEQRISITAALEQAQSRVIDAITQAEPELVEYKETAKQEQKAA